MRRAATTTAVAVLALVAVLSVASAQGQQTPVGACKQIDMTVVHPKAYHPHVGDLFRFYLNYPVIPGKIVDNLEVNLDGRSVGVVTVCDTSKGLPGSGEVSLFLVAKNLGQSSAEVTLVVDGKRQKKKYRMNFLVEERELEPSESALEKADVTPFGFGLGDLPVEEQYYKDHMLSVDSLEALATFKSEVAAARQFDARDRSWVTPAKNQGSCRSCWAFAAAGTIESRILKESGPEYDLSEQQQVSCNQYMDGCCGGNGRSLLFYCNNRPWLERNARYSEPRTRCPTQRTKECSVFNCQGLKYLASGFYTVEKNIEAMKRSLVEHGPCYFRYDVHQDFGDFWTNGTPGQVYTQHEENKKGGHAVLIIGWSDVKQGWLLKNSWRSDGGPNKDGTFWMAYRGHANDLNFQMFNIASLVKTN